MSQKGLPMPHRPILAADDIENRTDSGRRRSRAIISAASALAERLDTRIDLLYVEDIKSYPHGRFDSPRVRAWHSGHLKALEAAGTSYQVPIRSLIKGGHPAEQILKVLRAKAAPELVVMGTQGRKGMKYLLVGSVAEEVIRHARRPVMVVGPVAQEKSWFLAADRGQPRILVATDLGKNSRAAEQYALSLAKRIGARVVLYHCLGDSYRTIVQESSMVSGWVPMNLNEILDGIRDDSVRALEQKADFFQKRSVPCEYKIEDKPVASSCAVYQESARGYSFVVMGTRGRNVMMEAYFGSTARETILNSPVPVMTVHFGA